MSPRKRTLFGSDFRRQNENFPEMRSRGRFAPFLDGRQAPCFSKTFPDRRQATCDPCAHARRVCESPALPRLESIRGNFPAINSIRGLRALRFDLKAIASNNLNDVYTFSHAAHAAWIGSYVLS